MIARTEHVSAALRLLRQAPVVAILGARQVGKTTLARQIVAAWTGGPVERFDLEDADDLARLDEPLLALRPLRGLVILDEVQRTPEIFPALRVLADRRPLRARFLLLGSASPDLLQQASESLAGRIHYLTLPGLSLSEVGVDRLERLWRRGGFPASLLARSESASADWRRGFIRTFLERDLPQLGVRVPSPTLRRFWAMLAHWHGQVWNAAEFARSFGVGEASVRRYLDVLTGALVVRQLQPWHANLKKRQVKAPKIYLLDSGVLHTLLGIERQRDLEHHPKLGASWEGFVLDQVLQRRRVAGWSDDNAYFWASHGGAELDLLVVRGRRRLGFEFKRTSAPRVAPSMRSALADLELEELVVVHAGEHSFQMAPRIRAVAASRLLVDL